MSSKTSMGIINYVESDVKHLAILENWSGEQLGHSSQMKEHMKAEAPHVIQSLKRLS